MSLLDVKGLEVEFATPDGPIHAVNGVDLQLAAGEALGVVGESGCGKSQTVLALMGLLARNAAVRGSARLDGQELIGLPRAALDRVRGARIGMIFQDPMTCLNPYLKIGTQLAEVLQVHRGASRASAWQAAREALDTVQLADAERRLHAYPHELSGGQRQRVMIAMALMCRPALLLADEPTTALDVTVQAQILRLLDQLRRELQLGIVLITHDLGVVAELCERTAVMYAGRIVESGPTRAVLSAPQHPYTQALMRARPTLALPRGSRLPTLAGQPPVLRAPPHACSFAERCAQASAECQRQLPPYVSVGAEHQAACLQLR